MDVYEKLQKQGKNAEIVGSVEDFEFIASRNPKGLYCHLIVDDEDGSAQKKQDYKDCLSDYHIVGSARRSEIENLIRKWSIVKVIANSGPGYSTETITYNIVTQAFGNNMLGYSSAIAVFLFVVIAAVSVLQIQLSKKLEVS